MYMTHYLFIFLLSVTLLSSSAQQQSGMAVTITGPFISNSKPHTEKTAAIPVPAEDRKPPKLTTDNSANIPVLVISKCQQTIGGKSSK